MRLANGMAGFTRDELGDGAGFFLGAGCTRALTIQVREARVFDEHAAEAKTAQGSETYIA